MNTNPENTSVAPPADATADSERSEVLVGAPMSRQHQKSCLISLINRADKNFTPTKKKFVSRQSEAVAQGINAYALGQLKFYMEGLALQDAFGDCMGEFYQYYLNTLIHAYEIYMVDICGVCLTDVRNDTLLLIRGKLSRAKDNNRNVKQYQNEMGFVTKRIRTVWYQPRKSGRLYQTLMLGAMDATVIKLFEHIIRWQARHLEHLYQSQLAGGGDTQALQEQIEIQQAQIAQLGDDMAVLKAQLSESGQEMSRLRESSAKLALESQSTPIGNPVVVVESTSEKPKAGWMSLFTRKEKPKLDRKLDVVMPIRAGQTLRASMNSGL